MTLVRRDPLVYEREGVIEREGVETSSEAYPDPIPYGDMHNQVYNHYSQFHIFSSKIIIITHLASRHIFHIFTLHYLFTPPHLHTSTHLTHAPPHTSQTRF